MSFVCREIPSVCRPKIELPPLPRRVFLFFLRPKSAFSFWSTRATKDAKRRRLVLIGPDSIGAFEVDRRPMPLSSDIEPSMERHRNIQMKKPADWNRRISAGRSPRKNNKNHPVVTRRSTNVSRRQARRSLGDSQIGGRLSTPSITCDRSRNGRGAARTGR